MDRLRAALTSLGLSEREREVYVAVLSRGEVTVSALASEVARDESTVLRVAADLVERGLVAVRGDDSAEASDDASRPDAGSEPGPGDDAGETPGDGRERGTTVLAAVPPGTAATSLSDAVSAFEAAAASVYGGDSTAADAPIPAFSPLVDPAGVRRRLREELATARREVLAILPSEVACDLREALASAVERGATVYLLVLAPGEEHAASALSPGEHAHVLRSWSRRPVCFLLRDVRGAVLGEPDAAVDARGDDGSTGTPGTSTDAPGTPTDAPGTPTGTPGTPTDAPGTPTGTPGTPTDAPGTPTGASRSDPLGGRRHGRAPAADARAVAIQQPHVAGWLYGNAVANLWSNGTQRWLADPPSLPATYEHFRSGVTAAALHDLAGTELAVDVECTDLATGEPASLAGAPVREVRQSLLEPTNVAFPTENALVVETADGRVSVGAETDGLAAFEEDYAATSVTLRTPR